jgi:hypothetical protein
MEEALGSSPASRRGGQAAAGLRRSRPPEHNSPEGATQHKGFRFSDLLALCYTPFMRKFLIAVATLLALTSFADITFGPYVSPRIYGRVLAADTRAPLAGVKIIREDSFRNRVVDGAPKGAEQLVQKAAVLSDTNGAFQLSSEKALTVFRPAGWSHVKLSFEANGYRSLQTNFSILSPTTNSPSGEPALLAGDILLIPLRK